MGRPGPDHDPLDRAAAARAGLAGPLVDLELLLHRSVAVRRRVVVDRTAAPLDSLRQDRPHLPIQPPLVGRSQRPGRAQRVEPRRPKRLVRIDVPDTGHERLVEQQRLEAPVPPAEQQPKVAQGERRIERFRAETGEYRRAADLRDKLPGVRIAAVQADLPELADVAKPDFPPVGKTEDKADVRVDRLLGWHHEQLPGHLEMNGQGGVSRQLDDDQLGAPSHRLHAPAGDRRGEGLRGMRPQGARPRTACAHDRRAHDPRAQVARDGLDLGEFGHGAEPSRGSARWAPRGGARRLPRQWRPRASAASSIPSRRRP